MICNLLGLRTCTTRSGLYLYDRASYNGLTIANGIGRRTGMTDQAGSEAWSYDVMGRISTDQRTTNALARAISYTYNLDGSLSTATHPKISAAPPLIITFQQGGAGRPISESSADATYATNVHYAPNGSLCYFLQGWGDETTTNWTFNNRFQPVRIYESGAPMPPPTPCTAPTQATTLPIDFTYSYLDANGHNNGNVMQNANNTDWHRWQYFTYDSLNRIATAKTSATNQPGYPGDNSIAACWGEQFGYDPWGNLLSISGVSSAYTGCTQENLSLSVNTKNQVMGDTYDSAGNLILAQPGNVQYTYDAENHLTSTAGQTYLYDGDGKRVEKATNGTPLVPNKLYWYGTDSSPVIETDAAGNELYRYFRFSGMLLAREEGANDWVDHYGVDALGNVRWVYSLNGARDSSDYYPFGGERVILQASNNSRKFTGKERDSESGLDNFGARYDSSSMGRFMSPDPIYIEEQKMLDPQELNLYSYVRNNPLNLTDSTGMLVDVNCQQVTVAQCSQTVADFNNRDGAQFQVTRDDKTGQLNVNGDVDPTKLSGGERALYNSITNTDATGTVTVVGNDPSFDFEKSTGKGQNSVDRSDLNALNGADKRLSGEVISHAALESYDSAKPGVSVDQAHDFAQSFFGFKYGRFTPNFASQVNTLFLNFRSTRLNEDFRATLTLKTPIPMVTFRKMQAEGGVLSLPRDVTKATLLP